MTPDISILKQDLKEGVTKMAGKLSNMASNVMTSFNVSLITCVPLMSFIYIYCLLH